jgi:acyl transferase domain-containing protein
VIQPVLFTVAVALAAQWMHWGVTPSAVIGHSMGEVAAAYVAGALGLDDAVRIICRRSELLRRVSGQGAMLATELTRDEAQEVLVGREHLISIAVSNSARSTVLSGDRSALAEVEQELGEDGVFCRWVKVEVASHSPQMDPLRSDLLAVLDGVAPRAGQVPIFSTVLSRVIDGSEMRSDYWVSNLREPVWFADAVRAAGAAGHDVFLELSPHPILLPAIEQELAELRSSALVLGSLRRNDAEREGLLRSAGALFVRGLSLDLRNIAPSSGSCCSLPSYCWQRESYWRRADEVASPQRTFEESWLGRHMQSASQPYTHYFDALWGDDMRHVVQGHVVAGETIAPGALLVKLALLAIEKASGKTAWRLGPIHFESPLVLAPRGLTNVQIVVVIGSGAAEIKLFTASGGAFTLHAQAWARRGLGSIAVTGGSQRSADSGAVSRRYGCGEYYAQLSRLGLEYGSAYLGIEQIEVDHVCATARIDVHAAANERHAAVAGIDAALQALIAVLPPEARAEGCALVSGGMDGFEQIRPLPARFVSRATLRQSADREYAGDVEAWSDADELLFRATGVRVLTHTAARRTQHAEPAGAVAAPTWLAELSQLDAARQCDRVLQALREIVGNVVKLAPSRVPTDVPLRALGMDSVMALELRNRIEHRIGARISATALYNYPTLEALSKFVLAQLPSVEPAAQAAPLADGSRAANRADLRIEQLLAAELEHVQHLMRDVG